MNSYCIFEGKSHFEALSFKEILENNNIYCIMPNEHLTGVVSYYFSFIGGFKILVSEKEIELATKILSEFGYINIDHCEPDINFTIKEYSLCPKCGKTHSD